MQPSATSYAHDFLRQCRSSSRAAILEGDACDLPDGILKLQDAVATRLTLLQTRIAPASLLPSAAVLQATNLTQVARGDMALLGITYLGADSTQLFVTEPAKSVGSLRLEIGGANAIVVIDNRLRGGRFIGNIRVPRANCLIALSTPDYGVANLNLISMRSEGQLLFWGHGATAVSLNIEIEGADRSVIVGDDALISSGIWIRNHDMHAVVDLETGAVVNATPVDTVIEPHVWIGQDALLLNCKQVGYGSILAAKSVVRGIVPATSVVAGVPGRIVRSGTSWARSVEGMDPREKAMLDKLKARDLSAEA